MRAVGIDLRFFIALDRVRNTQKRLQQIPVDRAASQQVGAKLLADLLQLVRIDIGGCGPDHRKLFERIQELLDP